MAFAAGALVFPGGRIDEADRKLAERLNADAARIAAIRETVEETAIAVGLAPIPSEDQALEIDAQTGFPGWDGERLDYTWAADALLTA